MIHFLRNPEEIILKIEGASYKRGFLEKKLTGKLNGKVRVRLIIGFDL